MKPFTKTFLTGIALCSITIITSAQSWNLAGNAGTTTSNFLGTTDTKDLIFKVNNAERGRLLNTPGAWRFGNATNFAKIDSAGKLTFGGTAAYFVGGNKYAFQYAAAPNYGLFFNSTNVRYEFRNGLATPIFYVDANNGNGVFAGSLKVGTYTLPAFDGVAGQVLKTDGTGILSWSADNNPIYTAGTGIDVNSTIITNTLPDQVITLTGNRATSITGTYPNFTISSTDNNTTYTSGTGIDVNIDDFSISNTAPDQTVVLNNGAGINITGSYPNFTIAATVASQWTTSAGNIYFNTGNVGIGTATPSAKLHIAGGDALINGITVGTGGGLLASNSAMGKAALFSNTTGYSNIANGDSALFSNTTGYNNVALGAGAMRSNTINSNNVAIGDSALYTNGIGATQSYLASHNTAVGSKALYQNSVGYDNTAIGYLSLYNNTTGARNTATGSSLYANTTGDLNTANGSSALYYNTTGNQNTANGADALYNNVTGHANTANGAYALNVNSIGGFNTANGYNALLTNSGSYNTASGANALDFNTSGSYNTAVGYNSDVSQHNLTNATAIGYNASVTASNNFVLGNSSVIGWGFGIAPSTRAIKVGTGATNGNGAYLTVGGVWTDISDKRKKENITQVDKSIILKKIQQLQITKWKYKGTNNEYHIGPMADQFHQLFEVGDDSSLSSMDKTGVLFLGLQELGAENEKLKNQNKEQQSINDAQQKEINELRSMIFQLQKTFSNCNPCSQQSITSNESQTPNAKQSSASLEQNIPNPFSNTTTINYTLPQQYSSAKIIVVDNTGKVLKKINISGSSKGSINFSAPFRAGASYNYTLYVDEKLIDTRQMILTK